MKNFYKKILGVLKNSIGFLTKAPQFLQKHKDVINIFLTFFLVTTTVMLIIYTNKSINASNNIAEIEILLVTEEERQVTLGNIILAEDLYDELIWNKDEFIIMIRDLESYKLNNMYRPDFLRTSKIIQSIDANRFGSKDMREKAVNYLTIIDMAKEDLEYIRIHWKLEDKVKIERIDNILFFSKSLLYSKFENVNIDEFINNVKSYINKQRVIYDNLDELYKEKLQKLNS